MIKYSLILQTRENTIFPTTILQRISKMKKLITVVLIVCASNVKTEPDESKEFENHMNEFSMDLFRDVSNINRKNIAISPLSAGLTLLMLAFGASGETMTKIFSTLHLDNSHEEIKTAIPNMYFETMANSQRNLKRARRESLWRKGWNTLVVKPGQKIHDEIENGFKSFKNMFQKKPNYRQDEIVYPEDDSFGNIFENPNDRQDKIVYPVDERAETINYETKLKTAENIHTLIDKLKSYESITLHRINQVFLSHKCNLNQQFQNDLYKTFEAKVQIVNFKNSKHAANAINNWCAENTNNEIKDIVKSEQLTDNTVMVLTNAIYFKGNWLYPFDPKNTKENPFYVTPEKPKTVKMMYQEGKFEFGEDRRKGIKFVKLPYERKNSDESTFMYVILPMNRGSLAKVLPNIYNLTFQDLNDRTFMPKVQLSLPQFKIESTLHLQKNLENLGLEVLFSKPDFSPMAKCNSQLEVSDIVQKVVIEVDEHGSKAAAATGVIIESRSFEEDQTMKVDEPFVVLITTNRGIIFMAKITDPTE